MKYISYDDFEKICYDGMYEADYQYALERFDECAIDVDQVVHQVVHGKWTTRMSGDPFLIYGECSQCGFEQSISKYLNYCPNCGVRMDDTEYGYGIRRTIMINVKSDMEYIMSTGHTIADDGTIPINVKDELVRCGDCVHWGTCVPGETEDIKCCEYAGWMVGKNGYCIYGERNTNDIKQ